MINSNVIMEAVAKVADEISKSNSSLDWKYLDELTLWRELISCILGSQVSFEVAKSALQNLICTNSLTPESFCGNLKKWESTLQLKLHEPLNVGSGRQRFRFPNVKSRQIANSWVSVYQHNDGLRSMLLKSDSIENTRKWLIANIHGMGPKQSSMFLRNIGYADDLAIIDSHVIRFLNILEDRNPITSSISSMKKYSTVENRLVNFASGLGQSLAVVDKAIWIVMRVATKHKYV